MKPSRTFSANVGQKSTGSAGPDYIEADIDVINKMFDPNTTHDDNSSGGIGTENVQDSSITNAKLASNSVTTSKVADSNITTAKIADLNITTAKIADASITSAKIADGTVTSTKISNIPASSIINTPAGNISSVNVQTALNELDTEKVPVTDVVTSASANKILKLDSNSKLPASVTGDADSTVAKLESHKTSSDHDTHNDSRYYTKTNLQTSGQAQMHWGNLTNVPNLADSSWKPAVASYSVLPTTGNSVGDMRVVADDGDGKSAMYHCKATTGTVAQQWEKLADLDWTNDHGALVGLSDDDHTQYHNDSRGDARYYTKTQIQGSGQAQVHFNNLSNKPTTIAGYGITDTVVSGSVGASGLDFGGKYILMYNPGYDTFDIWEVKT